MTREKPETSQTITFEPMADAGPFAAFARLHLVHPPGLTFGDASDSLGLKLGKDPIVFGRGQPGGAGPSGFGRGQPGSAGPSGFGRLAHGTISREHLRIAWDGRTRTHVATDLGSHNGTRINGRALPRGAAMNLDDGAVLTLGGVVLVYDGPHLDLHLGDPLAETIPGMSRGVRQLRQELAQAGPDPSPALVSGETGVGKEHIARALHTLSGRRGPLVAVNVAELAPQLVESQLFGHQKGAFTGADRPHDGLFRSADNGTLFLDEIGELPLDLQPKFLRVLQESEVRPVGATRGTRIDVRIVAATNRDLGDDIDRGKFRRDLFARLSLWQIRVPPLRERRADILTWCRALHDRWADERKRPRSTLLFEADAVEAMLLHPWPENLRGVDRFVHQLGTRASETPVTRTLVETHLGTTGASPSAPDTPIRNSDQAAVKRAAPASRAELEVVISECGGNMQAVARHYGRDRRQVYRWLDAFGIPRSGGADGDG